MTHLIELSMNLRLAPMAVNNVHSCIIKIRCN